MTKIPVQYNIICDGWKFIKKYLASNQTFVINNLLDDVDKFYQKYKTPFAKEIALACINEIDRVIKDKEGDKI